MRSVSLAASFLTLLEACLTAFGCSSGTATNSATDESPPEAPAGLEAAWLPVTRAELASIARGAVAFVDRTPHGLGGNGRACADCHMPSQAFQLSPANAEARFEALAARRKRDPSADDPLFRPIDADDFRINGANAS